MNPQTMMDLCEKQLDRILLQFSRIDSRAPVVLGSNLGMLAILMLNVPKDLNFCNLFALLACISILLNSISLIYLYKSQFPDFNGGSESLIYFSEISKNTEANYISKFSAMSAENATKEFLGQIWRNSSILKDKFRFFKTSLKFIGIAIPFWLVTLAFFVHQNKNFALS